MNLQLCHACRAVRTPAQISQAEASSKQSTAGKDSPWPFGFQVSERTLVWGNEAQRRLLLIHASKSMKQVWTE